MSALLGPPSPVPDIASIVSSPKYQAVLTPSCTSAQDGDLLAAEGIGRRHRHSHALSAILGATGRTSTSASTSVDPRSSSHLHVPATTTSIPMDQVPQTDKTELPGTFAKWRHWRRRWKKVSLFSVVFLLFSGWFAISCLVPVAMAPVLFGTSLSIVSTFTILVSFIRRRACRRQPNELLAFVAMSECALAVLTLFQVLTFCRVTDGTCRAMSIVPCSISVSLELFLLLTGVGWSGAAIFHLFVSVSNPFASYKRQLVLYHVLVWGLSFVISSVVTPCVLFSTLLQRKYRLTDAEICRMVTLSLPLLPSDAHESSASQTQRIRQWQALNVAFWGVVAAIVVFVVVAAQLSLILGWWRSTSGTIIALKARRRLMKRMTIYVHALNVMWLVLLVVFCLYRSNRRALAYLQIEGESRRNGQHVLEAWFRYVSTGKGFVTAAVWLCVNKPCCVLEYLFCGFHECKENDETPSIAPSSSSHSASSSECSSGHVPAPSMDPATLESVTEQDMEAGLRTLQESLLLSLSSTRLDMDTHTNVSTRSAFNPQDCPSLPILLPIVDPLRNARSSRSSSSSYGASTVGLYETSQSNETLQREIIYYTVCGITKAILRAAERAKEAQAVEPEGVEGASDQERGSVNTTLLVGAERDSTLVNSSFISHVQNVTIVSSPRLYCKPQQGVEPLHSRQSVSLPRPTSFTTMSTLDSATKRRSRLAFEPSRSHGSATPRRTRTRPFTSSALSYQRNSLYPVSQVPFELFEQEIELQSTHSSIDEPESRPTRSAVFAGLRRTATSAIIQGRGVFRSRSGSTDPPLASTSAVTREFLPDDPKPKVFVDYAPRAFRAIRLAFGLSDEKYLASFRTTAKERVSAGSSGAFMFYSGDNSLLVKSLKDKECRALVEMAPAYARYVTANRHSRLIRFFGCHRVRLYGRNFYFAVMSNVLHHEHHTATITEKYDVKGSWVDRRARRPQRGDRVTCAECDATYLFGIHDESDEFRALADTPRDLTNAFHIHRPDVVLKDLDLCRSFDLRRHVAEQLHAQIVLDCEFLRDLGIMDYSLLIGIHKCHLRPGEVDGKEFPSRDIGESGMNLAPLGEHEVYYVGIIDILQQWDWEKQFEKAGKVLLGKSARGISAVAPAAYCRRFQARCTQILLGGPPPEALDQISQELSKVDVLDDVDA
ncbi:hypothetical protein CCR75_009770 [Bremia lactucae]|uniref:PIPK domain-containing protein n=1 Tax=Bremia lactucae TaxID=4779 RepID=A0A976IF39_BRELC|nr:hypothetical protein CCR75_009770 [Bremia lactucae]